MRKITVSSMYRTLTLIQRQLRIPEVQKNAEITKINHILEQLVGEAYFFISDEEYENCAMKEYYMLPVVRIRQAVDLVQYPESKLHQLLDQYEFFLQDIGAVRT